MILVYFEGDFFFCLKLFCQDVPGVSQVNLAHPVEQLNFKKGASINYAGTIFDPLPGLRKHIQIFQNIKIKFTQRLRNS